MAELLTVSEVAKLLKVSRGAVQRWIRNGHLPTIKTPGGHYRITQSATEALMQEACRPRAAAEAQTHQFRIGSRVQPKPGEFVS